MEIVFSGPTQTMAAKESFATDFNGSRSRPLKACFVLGISQVTEWAEVGCSNNLQALRIGQLRL